MSQCREQAMMQGLKSWLKKIFRMDSPQRREQHRPDPAAATNAKGETTVLQPAYTKRLKPEQEAEMPASLKSPEPLTPAGTSITWCGRTDTGKVRTHNEDYFSCTDLQEGTLFVVADGMGGHDAGEVASRLAGEAVSREMLKHCDETDPEKQLAQAVQQANLEVLAEANSKGSNMGTTLTAALLSRDRAYIVNVGDSRTYWIENGSIRRITVDHSLVEKLVSLGKMTREEARTHPKSNVLYRNIGSEGLLTVDTFQIPLRKGGSLLLCTDGLWGDVSDEAIHKVFTSGKDPKKTCMKLIRTANENGGKDNITAIVVKVT
jgi:protein phosphatase